YNTMVSTPSPMFFPTHLAKTQDEEGTRGNTNTEQQGDKDTALDTSQRWHGEDTGRRHNNNMGQ
ncbi:hypothetical protein K443DRAFT_93186, partial [Laccaria amethystina LaAM-08-1]